MGKKYFAISDIHGFYDEMTLALTNAGFELDNPEHILIVCGDIFDRGKKPLEVYSFLRSLPKERRILIKGNHEALLNDLWLRGHEEDHDLHNRTYDTLCSIAKIRSETEWAKLAYVKRLNAWKLDADKCEKVLDSIDEELIKRRHKVFHCKKAKEIIDWINSDEWVNYFELGKFIFVHSFIPLKQEFTEHWGRLYPETDPEYNPDWRQNATNAEWDRAIWGCPWRLYDAGFFDQEKEKGKVLVCGHWHSSDFWNSFKGTKKDTYTDNPIFYDPDFNIIALDACTVTSGYINVLVVESDDCIEIHDGRPMEAYPMEIYPTEEEQ